MSSEALEPKRPDYELLAADSARRWLKHGRHDEGCDGCEVLDAIDDLQKRAEWLEAALAVAREREQHAVDALATLCQWTREHLDALPAEDEDGPVLDETGVLISLRCIVTGELGCTEEEDYTAAQWQALMAISAALADEPAAATLAEPGDVPEAPHGHTAVASLGAEPRPGSANAAADEPGSAVVWSEPRQDFPGGRIYRDGLATGTPSAAADDGRCPGCGWYVADCNCVARAAADEPGETP